MILNTVFFQKVNLSFPNKKYSRCEDVFEGRKRERAKRKEGVLSLF